MTSEDNNNSNFQELLDKLFPDEPSSGSDDDVSSPDPDQYTDWKRRRRTIVPKQRIPPLELQPTKEEEPSKPSPAPKTPEKQVHWTKNLAAPPAPKKPRPAVIVVRHPRPAVPPPPPPPAPAAAAAVPTIQAEEEDDWEPYTQPCPAGGWLAPLPPPPPPPPARAAAAIDDDVDEFAPAPSAKKPRLQAEEQQQQEQQQELPDQAVHNENRVIELHHNDNSVIELHIQILQGRGRSADYPIDLTH